MRAGELPKALLFDVFGTCVDWRASVIREGEALGRRLGLSGVDWAAFADAWRGQYQPQMESVRSGRRPWATLDVLHRESLDRLLRDFGLDHVPAAERAAFTLAWHRLDPWPDTAAGLARLKRRFVVAPCSNGHIALMIGLARHGGLAWDAILGAEIARAYKPQPAVYLRSAEAAGAARGATMMVAAHADDLTAATACGLRTAFVARPAEYGPHQKADFKAERAWDVVADSFTGLAAAMGC